MSDTIRIPVTAYMEMRPDGNWEIVPENSTYHDIKPDDFARFLLSKFGKDTIFNGDRG